MTKMYYNKEFRRYCIYTDSRGVMDLISIDVIKDYYLTDNNGYFKSNLGLWLWNNVGLKLL